MDFPKQFLRELFENYLQNTFSKVLPEIVKETLGHDAIVARQEFIALDEACKRYSLSRKRCAITIRGNTNLQFKKVQPWICDLLPWTAVKITVITFPIEKLGFIGQGNRAESSSIAVH